MPPAAATIIAPTKTLVRGSVVVVAAAAAPLRAREDGPVSLSEPDACPGHS